MFGTLFTVVGLVVSFVYPLNESFKLISWQMTQSAQADVNSRPLPLTKPQLQEQLQKWTIYWMVLSIFLLVKSNAMVRMLTAVIPFSSMIVLYLRFWLVFPMVTSVEGNSKVTGSFVLYQFYMLPWLVKLNYYLGGFRLEDCARYFSRVLNYVIDNYVPSLSFLKVQESASNGAWQTEPVAENGSFSALVSDVWQNSSAWRQQFQQQQQAPQDQQRQTDSLLAQYYPQVLVSSLVSPLRALLASELRDGKAEDFDLVTKDELKGGSSETLPEMATTTYLPKLRETSSSGSLRKASSGSFAQVQPTTARKSSWSFGWKSRSGSVGTVEQQEQ